MSRKLNLGTLHNIYIYISRSSNFGLPTSQHLNSKVMFARLKRKEEEGFKKKKQVKKIDDIKNRRF